MSSYRLSSEAESDLRDIFSYTLDRWGLPQAQKYAKQLEQCLSNIAKGTALTRSPFTSLPEVRSVKCQSHYIFFLADTDPFVIVAVLHQRMDIINRLKDRL